MSRAKTYERVLGALVAEARVGRLARVVSDQRSDQNSDKSCGGRAWINGKEVGDSNPRYAHLGHGHD